ncbi:unnamed protein product, partial [marine sediment metagenome]
IAVDLITLKALNIEIENNILFLEAKKKKIDIPSISNIRVRGEKIEDLNLDINFCVSNLNDINIRNFNIRVGEFCSGCFKHAYNLLNLMKTYMVKDLKYNPYNSFLIGENPLEPDRIGNIILFGDCAINSTKNYKFRKMIKETTNGVKNKTKKRVLKKKIEKPLPAIKEKSYKKILEIPGCPPNVNDCIGLILKYYGKRKAPNLNLLNKLNNTWISEKIYKKFKIWEAI